MKKLIALITILCMLTVSAYAFSDVAGGSFYYDSIERLTNLGILSGMGDGTFAPEKNLTRAQFAKIAVHVLGMQDSISQSSVTAFSDVPRNHWASGYISYANQNNIILGYPDGSFGAEENITYAQAITILVRLLGYTDAEVGYHWPKDYLEKAQSLSITSGLSFDSNSYISRGMTAYLTDKTLYTNKKDGTTLADNLSKSVYTTDGPYTLTSTDTIYLKSLFNNANLDTINVIRKGLKSSLSELSRFDVCYYSSVTNTIYAYTDRVSGIYEEALPMKSNVTSVNISGKTYALSTATAISKLNESVNAFKIGDRVTLLFGKNGEVVDAVSLDSSDVSNYGVIISSSLKVSEDSDSKGRNEYYTTLMLPTGEKTEYRTDKDYTDYRGEYRKIEVNDGMATLLSVPYSKISGKINTENKTIGSKYLASDYSILELVSLPDKGDAVVKKIKLEDISYQTLSESMVIHAHRSGKLNDIAVLYLDNVSGSRYSYGIVTEAGKTGGYSVLLNGVESKFNANLNKTVTRGTAVGVYVNNGMLEDIVTLSESVGGSKIYSYTAARIRLDSDSYPIADDVSVYYGSAIKDYKAVALEDIENLSYSSVKMYSDNNLSRGGKVRVIILSK